MGRYFVIQPDWMRLTRDQTWDLSMADTNDQVASTKAKRVLEDAFLEDRYISFEVEATDLDEVFAKLNADERPPMTRLKPFARVRSLSVGDAVVDLYTGTAYQVARIGFKPIEGHFGWELVELAKE